MKIRNWAIQSLKIKLPKGVPPVKSINYKVRNDS